MGGRSQKDRRPKPGKSFWVRTGGGQGDDSMEKLDRYAEDGCGVSEAVESVDCDPNHKFGKTSDKKHIS